MSQTDQPADPIERVEIEAVFAKALQAIGWCELQDDSVWRQGGLDARFSLKGDKNHMWQVRFIHHSHS